MDNGTSGVLGHPVLPHVAVEYKLELEHVSTLVLSTTVRTVAKVTLTYKRVVKHHAQVKFVGSQASVHRCLKASNNLFLTSICIHTVL